MLGSMLSLADAVRRLWRRLLRTAPGTVTPGAGGRFPSSISVLALAGATTGVVLATDGRQVGRR